MIYAENCLICPSGKSWIRLLANIIHISKKNSESTKGIERKAWKKFEMQNLTLPPRLSDFTFTFHFNALEKEMGTHSSIFAWRIPGMGEPGGRPSMGSHRVGHDWSDLAAAAAPSPIDWIHAEYPTWPSAWQYFHIMAVMGPSTLKNYSGAISIQHSSSHLRLQFYITCSLPSAVSRVTQGPAKEREQVRIKTFWEQAMSNCVRSQGPRPGLEGPIQNQSLGTGYGIGRVRALQSLSQQNFYYWHPTPVLLPGKSHGWRSLVGCSPWGR